MSRAAPLFVFRPEDFVFTESTDSNEDFIAAGRFGEVFRARFATDKSYLLPDYHKEYLALKLVTGSRVNDRCRKSLEKEAAILHQIPVHRNIVTLLGVWLHPRRFALVLEFMDGGSLAELLEDPPEYPWSERLDACKQIACGMNHLHCLRLPVIHMDLSSANVLTDTTTSKRTYKIADFGLSKMRNISTSNVGSHSGCCGTLHFIAPERLAGGSIDVRRFPETAMRADVYSFGIIMYHIKECHLPYKDEIVDVVIANVRDGISPRLSDTSCPSGFNELMTKCYHKEAVARPEFQAICVALDNLHIDGHGSSEASLENTITRSAGNQSLSQTRENLLIRRVALLHDGNELQSPPDLSVTLPRQLEDLEVAIRPKASSFSAVRYSTPVEELIGDPASPCIEEISKLLDQEDAVGDDWHRLCRVLLDRTLSETLVSQKKEGPTRFLLKVWCRMKPRYESTVGHLIQALNAAYRNDVAKVLEKCCKMYNRHDHKGKSVAETQETQTIRLDSSYIPRDLVYIVTDLTRDRWRQLGEQLGFSKLELLEYESDRFRFLKERVGHVIFDWQRRDGDSATVHQLLVACDMVKVGREVRRKAQSEHGLVFV